MSVKIPLSQFFEITSEEQFKNKLVKDEDEDNYKLFLKNPIKWKNYTKYKIDKIIERKDEILICLLAFLESDQEQVNNCGNSNSCHISPQQSNRKIIGFFSNWYFKKLFKGLPIFTDSKSSLKTKKIKSFSELKENCSVIVFDEKVKFDSLTLSWLVTSKRIIFTNLNEN
jgi:hypothetical protein